MTPSTTNLLTKMRARGKLRGFSPNGVSNAQVVHPVLSVHFLPVSKKCADQDVFIRNVRRNSSCQKSAPTNTFIMHPDKYVFFLITKEIACCKTVTI